MHGLVFGRGSRRLVHYVLDAPSDRWRDLGLLVLRSGIGLLMVTRHGYPKLSAYKEMYSSFGDPIGLGGPTSYVLAVFAELFCSVGLIVGLATRLATVPLMVTMSVAAFVVHAADPFARKELALIYLTAFVALAILGPGAYSVDGLVRRALRRP